jgi:hypothetical protein
VNRVLEESAIPPPWHLMLAVAPAIPKLVILRRAIDQERGADTVDFLLPVPPVLVTALRPLAGQTLPVLLGSTDQLLNKLDLILPIHPDATLYYLRGVYLLEKNRWEEAERDFTTASTASSIVDVRKSALFCAINCQWYLARQPGRTDQAELKARALQNTRKLVAQGVSPDAAPYLIVVALGTGEDGLASVIVSDWERLAPNDLSVQHKRLEIEFAQGAYGRVLETASKVLKRDPRDKVALQYQALARARIREQSCATGQAD